MTDQARMKRKTHKGSNKYLNAKHTFKGQHVARRRGLIWRTLATRPEGLYSADLSRPTG